MESMKANVESLLSGKNKIQIQIWYIFSLLIYYAAYDVCVHHLFKLAIFDNQIYNYMFSTYHQVSNIRRIKIPTRKRFSYCLVAVFAEYPDVKSRMKV